MDAPWPGLEPGDVAFTRGSGPFAWLIRHGSPSPFAHALVIHEILADGTLRCAEAWASQGMRWYDRDPSELASVLRVWRNDHERHAVLGVSRSMVDAGLGYAFGEIVRIVLYKLRLRVTGWETSRVICSNHVAQSAVAARPELLDPANPYRLEYPPEKIWPGLLHEQLAKLAWVDARRP